MKLVFMRRFYCSQNSVCIQITFNMFSKLSNQKITLNQLDESMSYICEYYSIYTSPGINKIGLTELNLNDPILRYESEFVIGWKLIKKKKIVKTIFTCEFKKLIKTIFLFFHIQNNSLKN